MRFDFAHLKRTRKGFLAALLILALLVSACRGPAGNQATPVATSTPSPLATATPTATATPSFPTSPRLPELSFYPIDKPDYQSSYNEKTAMIYVITDLEDPVFTDDKFRADATQRGLVSMTSREKIRATDFSKYFVLVAFQGYRGHTFTGIEIKKVYDMGGGIAVVAEFTEAPPWGGVTAAITSPYHVVAVSKEGMARQGDIVFELYDQIYTFRAYTRHSIS